MMQQVDGGWWCEECQQQLTLDDPNYPGPNTSACFGLVCEACEMDADYDEDDPREEDEDDL